MSGLDRSVVLRDRDGLYVSASLRGDGALEISGQDLRHGEYEYFLTVGAEQVPNVIAALGGEQGDDLLGLLEKHGDEIVRRGEKSWLEAAGVKVSFFSPS